MLLAVGFNNYLVLDQVVAILPFESVPIKRVVQSILEEKPRNLLNCTRGRKARTLIVLTGDRYVLSTIPTKQVRSRYYKAIGQDEVNEESEVTRSSST